MDEYTLALTRHLEDFVSSNRLQLFQRILADRSRYLTVLLEDIYQPQNASAVLRTCDCLGIQDVHIVEECNKYELNPDVSLGSNQWLSLWFYNEDGRFSEPGNKSKPEKEGGKNILRAVNHLRERGYRIVATSPHRRGSTPETFDLLKGKAAFMFGTELHGLSSRALDLADEYLRIPMAGFTESLNISVSAAVILYTIRNRLESSPVSWRLDEEEKRPIYLDWLRNSIRMSDAIERKFRKEWQF